MTSWTKSFDFCFASSAVRDVSNGARRRNGLVSDVAEKKTVKDSWSLQRIIAHLLSGITTAAVLSTAANSSLGNCTDRHSP